METGHRPDRGRRLLAGDPLANDPTHAHAAASSIHKSALMFALLMGLKPIPRTAVVKLIREKKVTVIEVNDPSRWRNGHMCQARSMSIRAHSARVSCQATMRRYWCSIAQATYVAKPPTPHVAPRPWAISTCGSCLAISVAGRAPGYRWRGRQWRVDWITCPPQGRPLNSDIDL